MVLTVRVLLIASLALAGTQVLTPRPWLAGFAAGLAVAFLSAIWLAERHHTDEEVPHVHHHR
jgi:hypothetical protein